MRTLAISFVCALALLLGCDSADLDVPTIDEEPKDSTEVPYEPPELFPARPDSAIVAFALSRDQDSPLVFARLNNLHNATIAPAGLDLVTPMAFQTGTDNLVAYNRRGIDQLVIVSASSGIASTVGGFFVGLLANFNQMVWPRSSDYLYLNPRVHYDPASRQLARMPFLAQATEEILINDVVPIAARNEDILVHLQNPTGGSDQEIRIYDPTSDSYKPTRDGSQLTFGSDVTNFVHGDFDPRNVGLAIVVNERVGIETVHAVYFCHVGFTNFERIWETNERILNVMVSVDGHVYMELDPGVPDQEYLGRISFKAPASERELEVVVTKEDFEGANSLMHFISSHFEG